MRISKMFMPTQREIPAEAEIISHQLMLRAGLMRKLASGIYSYLPLGYRTFRKIEQIVREEMDRAGAQELIMPAILPSEIYQESGRWEVFGPDMFRLKDRSGRDFCLGPTHEESFTETVRNEIHSYRSLPVTLYQIQNKYRDEKRPRFGVMRSREFVMKDAYSFDRDDKGLDISYQAMAKAYCRIFDRCSLDYIVVDADSGAMGGSGSQEFMVKSAVGEANIAFCVKCGYAANDEKAVCRPSSDPVTTGMLPMEKIHTPRSGTIDELMAFLGLSPDKFAKSLIYKADDKLVIAMVRGDHEVNETKLTNLLKCKDLALASARDVEDITGANVGFAGPVGLPKIVEVIADTEITCMVNMVTGANETDYHFKNVNYLRDFTPSVVADIRTVVKGDECPVCGAPVDICRGIEVGHIFKLGTKYSDALGCRYLDEDGKENPMIMGSYGIGVNRTMAAVIEQNNDENGIIWPMAVAPYHVVIVPVMISDEIQMNMAEELYKTFQDAGIEVLLDDRDERPGVKFKDSELIGIPLRITVGRKAKDGIIEFKERKGGQAVEMTPAEAFAKTKAIITGN
ncbi:MAG: proline--tRNA ligase [Saccharofermentanales bacterium]